MNDRESQSNDYKTEATSDEEMAAYEDRRNGIGAHFVPMVMQAKQQQQMEYQQHIHRNSNFKTTADNNIDEDPSKRLNTNALTDNL